MKRYRKCILRDSLAIDDRSPGREMWFHFSQRHLAFIYSKPGATCIQLLPEDCVDYEGILNWDLVVWTEKVGIELLDWYLSEKKFCIKALFCAIAISRQRQYQTSKQGNSLHPGFLTPFHIDAPMHSDRNKEIMRKA